MGSENSRNMLRITKTVGYRWKIINNGILDMWFWYVFVNSQQMQIKTTYIRKVVHW